MSERVPLDTLLAHWGEVLAENETVMAPILAAQQEVMPATPAQVAGELAIGQADVQIV